MGYYDWKWNRLPESEHAAAIDAYNNVDIDILVNLHNKYKLSNNDYCCSPDAAMMNFFGHAIKNGYIK